MTSLADRLRGVVRPQSPAADPPDARSVQGDERTAADVLGAEWREVRGQRFLTIDREYSTTYRHGRVTVGESAPPADGVWRRLDVLAGTACGGTVLFLDVETTGLAGGAGSYAFLIGCGWFAASPQVFRTRQFFLSSFGAERGLLDALVEAAAGAGTLVTYNGKTFDVPLIENRFALHRMEPPFAGLPHLDMLHPARRLWRSDSENGSIAAAVESGCRLTALEQSLCGYARRGDVPGFEIPSRYFHYVRSGDARGLEAVMEHNRLDLLALALITARAAALVGEGPAGARTAREALGIGRLYQRAGLHAEARAAFARAVDMTADTATHADALRAHAAAARRERRHDEAASAWRRLVALPHCPPAIAREAVEALAVHHEHRLRDAAAARSYALRSMTLQPSPSRQRALQHRLARLDRKIGAPPAPVLF